MKKIEATIKPAKLREVRDALGELGILGMTVSSVEGFGRKSEQMRVYRGTQYPVCALPGAKIELVVADSRAGDAVSAIAKAARIVEIGDGNIFISTVEDAFSIRNEERGDKA